MSDDTEALAEVRLTNAERELIVGYFLRGSDGAVLVDRIERIIAARIVQARAGEGALREASPQDLRDVASWIVREADQRVKFFPQRRDGVDDVMRAVASGLFRAAFTDTAGDPR